MSFGRSSSNTSQIVCSGPLWMGVRLCPGEALVEKPGIQLVVALEPQPRRLYRNSLWCSGIVLSESLGRRRLVAEHGVDLGEDVRGQLPLVLERREIVLELALLGGAEDHGRDIRVGEAPEQRQMMHRHAQRPREGRELLHV